MTGIFTALGFPTAMSSGTGNCRRGNTTADGGKCSRLDQMIDIDAPLPKSPATELSQLKTRLAQIETPEEKRMAEQFPSDPIEEARRREVWATRDRIGQIEGTMEREKKEKEFARERKSFTVTTETRAGGTGLYHGKEKE